MEGGYEHLATKGDVMLVKSDVLLVRAELERAIANLIKWMVGIAVALFIPIYGALITILILLLNK